MIPMKKKSLVKTETVLHLLGTRVSLPGNYGGLGRRYYDQLGQDLDKIIQVRITLNRPQKLLFFNYKTG